MNQGAFGEALADALADHQISTAQAGRMAGVSQSMISHWTNGRNVPNPDQVFALEDGLGLAPGQLSRHLGYVPNKAVALGWADPSVSEAVRSDPRLRSSKDIQDTFLDIYRLLAALAQRLDDDSLSEPTA